jgi:DNA-binding transcriptional LysR family regulator
MEHTPFIRFTRSSFGGQLVDQFLSRERIVVQDVIEIVDLHGIASMVASGVGVALVPRTLGLRAWSTGLTALDLGAQTFYREIGIIRNLRHSRHLAIQRFVDEIIRVWGDEPAMPIR